MMADELMDSIQAYLFLDNSSLHNYNLNVFVLIEPQVLKSEWQTPIKAILK